jgi:hypothetical protein
LTVLVEEIFTTEGLTTAATSDMASSIFERVSIVSFEIFASPVYPFEWQLKLDEMTSPKIMPIRVNSDAVTNAFFLSIMHTPFMFLCFTINKKYEEISKRM